MNNFKDFLDFFSEEHNFVIFKHFIFSNQWSYNFSPSENDIDSSLIFYKCNDNLYLYICEKYKLSKVIIKKDNWKFIDFVNLHKEKHNIKFIWLYKINNNLLEFQDKIYLWKTDIFKKRLFYILIYELNLTESKLEIPRNLENNYNNLLRHFSEKINNDISKLETYDINNINDLELNEILRIYYNFLNEWQKLLLIIFELLIFIPQLLYYIFYNLIIFYISSYNLNKKIREIDTSSNRELKEFTSVKFNEIDKYIKAIRNWAFHYYLDDIWNELEVNLEDNLKLDKIRIFQKYWNKWDLLWNIDFKEKELLKKVMNFTSLSEKGEINNEILTLYLDFMSTSKDLFLSVENWLKSIYKKVI